MELWRTAANPWGQDVLIGVSWDLMWLALIGAVVFTVGHAAWFKVRGFTKEETAVEPAQAAGVPERVVRHTLAARLFHWTMAASMLVLLVTAFVPVIGIQFPWVTIHWIAGVVLILTIVYHVIHSIGWQDFWSMMSMGAKDAREGIAHLKHVLSSNAPEPEKPGKYPFDHRMYHHAIVVVSLAAMITGGLMMLRVQTPFWAPNTYLFEDSTWGVMYVIHGLSGVSLITMVAAHIYFALRPDKRWFTWAMIRGWVDRDQYLAHFDTTKWSVTDGSEAPGAGGGAIADAAVSARREDD